MGCSCQNQSSQAKPDPPSEPEFDELENAKAARALALLIYHGLASIPPESLPPDWQAGYQAGACHELGA